MFKVYDTIQESKSTAININVFGHTSTLYLRAGISQMAAADVYSRSYGSSRTKFNNKMYF